MMLDRYMAMRMQRKKTSRVPPTSESRSRFAGGVGRGPGLGEVRPRPRRRCSGRASAASRRRAVMVASAVVRSARSDADRSGAALALRYSMPGVDDLGHPGRDGLVDPLHGGLEGGVALGLGPQVGDDRGVLGPVVLDVGEDGRIRGDEVAAVVALEAPHHRAGLPGGGDQVVGLGGPHVGGVGLLERLEADQRLDRDDEHDDPERHQELRAELQVAEPRHGDLLLEPIGPPARCTVIGRSIMAAIVHRLRMPWGGRAPRRAQPSTGAVQYGSESTASRQGTSVMSDTPGFPDEGPEAQAGRSRAWILATHHPGRRQRHHRPHRRRQRVHAHQPPRDARGRRHGRGRRGRRRRPRRCASSASCAPTP